MAAPVRRRREIAVDVETATIRVYRTITKSGVVTEEDEKATPIKVRKFLSDPAYVRVSAGVTKNLGNYESLRLDVAITLPCYREEIETTIPVLSDMVGEALDKEVEAYIS